MEVDSDLVKSKENQAPSENIVISNGTEENDRAPLTQPVSLRWLHH
jgi:hypothetical protein